MATLSTHVLDTAAGRPAAGVPVTLLDADGVSLAEGVTDDDGRVGSLGGDLATGTYRLRFAVDGPFYPEVVISFSIRGRRAPPRAAAAEPVRLLDLPWQLSTTTSSSAPPVRSWAAPSARWRSGSGTAGS